MELLLQEEDIQKLTYKPHVELIDEKTRKYYVYNKLSTLNPSLLFRASDDDHTGTIAFSCFVDDARLIPQFTIGEDGQSRWLWKEITCDGLAKLHGEEKLFFYGQSSTEKETINAAEVSVKEGVVLMDIFTMSIIEGTDMQFIVNDSNALKVERITMQENDEDLQARQEFRRNMIRKFNAMIDDIINRSKKE